MKNPIQPLANDGRGVLRFKENAIVRHLLDWATERGMGMNQLACMKFGNDDRSQFAQLIGYSLDGYGSLGYVTDEDYSAAALIAEDGMSEAEARIATLEAKLAEMRDAVRALREPLAALLEMHPDDLAKE